MKGPVTVAIDLVARPRRKAKVTYCFETRLVPVKPVRVVVYVVPDLEAQIVNVNGVVEQLGAKLVSDAFARLVVCIRDKAGAVTFFVDV